MSQSAKGAKSGKNAAAPAPKKPAKVNPVKALWRKLTKMTKGSEKAKEQKQKVLETVTKSYPLDKDERKHVAKAWAEELERRHDERVARRKGGDTPQVPVPPGTDTFPIPLNVPRKRVKSQDAVPEAPPEAPAAAEEAPAVVAAPEGGSQTGVPSGSSLEDQRKQWISKSLSGKESSTASKTLSSLSGGSSKTFGGQPSEIQLDDDTVKELQSHTFFKMLNKVLVDAVEKKSQKQPADMGPEELVELRGQNRTKWDDLVRANTVVSFGISKPTEEDVEKAKKIKQDMKKKGSRPKVHFADDVEVARARVGSDFTKSERIEKEQSRLKK